MTWVFGVTLDGRIAAPDGSSRWISSSQARVDAHEERAAHDAVLVGSGAARTDDPQLAVRHGVRGRQPLVDLPDVQSIADLRTFRIESVERVGDDVRIIAFTS